MSDMILYNYKLSPFSEKIRLMFGYCDMSWQSVIVKAQPPRPVLDVLAGGYRKIPVAQIGADVFCDTKRIAREIARLSGKPELDIENCSQEAQAFAHRTDLEVFLAFIVASGAGLLPTLIKETSFVDTLRFLKDRIGFARKAKVKPLSGAQAKQVCLAHVDDLEQRLDDDFLFGARPCAADFSAYHSLWISIELAGKRWLADAPKTQAWYDRMKALGTGQASDLNAEAALDIARDAEPAKFENPVDPRPVSIAPADYARDPVMGLLVAEDASEWVLQREHERIGRVNLHFPKAGYELKPQD